MAPFTFDAVFDRSSGEKLGIRTSKEGKSLYIKAIDDGAVHVWNVSHSDASSEVRPGDRIVEVNGISGDASMLSEQCKQNMKLHVKIEAAVHEIEMESEEEAPLPIMAKVEPVLMEPMLICDDQGTNTFVFEVILDRSSGMKLGIRTSKDSTSIGIEAIDDGAVKVWNAAHLFTPTEVQIGDRIIEVNGVTGDASALSKACKETTKLCVKLHGAPRSGMEAQGVSVGDLVAPVAGQVMTWVGDLGESLSESLPEATKAQVKELTENLGEVTKEKLGNLSEATKEVAVEFGEVAKELAADFSVVAKEQVKELAGGYGDAIRVPGKVHNFPSSKGKIQVVEQGALAHGCRILSSRAECCVSHASYDLRRLRVGGGGGGFVELRDLLKLEREVHLMEHLKPHPHVVQCHATLVENWGKQHCRLLLCDPCVKSLEIHVRVNGGRLTALETKEIGHQIAQGLQFLHGHDGTGIICGSVSTSAVLCGTDGLWKLGDIGVSTDVPVTAEEWREAHRSNRLHKDEPPEVQAAAEDKSLKVTTAADVWMLGVMLATCAIGRHPFSSPWHPPMAFSDYTIVKEKELFKPPARALLEPLCARLCLLISWMLESKPEHRLQIFEASALLSTLAYTSAEELLQDMPEKVRTTFEDLIVSAAQELSKEQTPGWALARLQVALTTKVMRTGSSPAPQTHALKEVDVTNDGAASESTEDVQSSDGNSSDMESEGGSNDKPVTQKDFDDFFSSDDKLACDEPCTKSTGGYAKANLGYSGNPFDEESPFVAESLI
jgi:serine/threonine protein kinase